MLRINISIMHNVIFIIRRFVYMAILILLYVSPVFSQIYTAKTNMPVDIEFTSSKAYENPIADIELKVQFDGPAATDTSITQFAFWDGGSSYTVRFSPPFAGQWNFTTTASDESNKGLHNQQGSIDVTSYEGDLNYAKKGWLKTSDNGRYLTYQDGTPFFYLGDTAWEISWKSTKEGVLEYLDDRQAKGFNAIQFVPMSHQRIRKFGVRNRNGEPYFINENFEKLNPKYFQYVDFIVNEINKRDMVAVIVPLWAGMNELHFNPTWKDYFLNRKESLLIANYIGARYAGHNVIWIIGGDDRYDSDEEKEFWDTFAKTIKKTTGNRQLATLHVKGFQASFDYFDNQTPWLDFHMYQSSHRAKADYTWQAGQRGYRLKPNTPVLNGEMAYEDIFHKLWQPGDTTKAETFRIRSEHIRQAAYESILSGSMVGITYGGNGIWQWNVPDMWASHSPRFTVSEAIHFEGSSHMSVLKNILVESDWFSLKPAFNIVLDSDAGDVVPTALSNKRIITYIPTNSKWVDIGLPQDKKLISDRLVNPRSGETESSTEYSVESQRNVDELRVSTPDTTDWIYIAELSDSIISDVDDENLVPQSFTLSQNYPNPFNPSTVIDYQLAERSQVIIDIFSISGENITTLINRSQSAGFHSVTFDASGLSSGVYIYRLQAGSQTITRKMILLK